MIAHAPIIRKDILEALATVPIPGTLQRMATGTADRIQTRRQDLSLSQAELAALIGCSREQVSQWETGHRHPSTEDTITAICKALRCSADYLFGMAKRP